MVRFLADASLNHAVVAGCLRREPAIDFLSAHAARLEGVSDADVLALAARLDRILVTHDFQTMPKHFGEFIAGGGSSPGVFLVKRRTPLAQVIEEAKGPLHRRNQLTINALRPQRTRCQMITTTR